MSNSERLSNYNGRFFQIKGLLILIGLSLVFYNFFLNKSLNIDEAWLALNLIDRSYWELTKALDHLQVAPILFLWIQKFVFYVAPWKDLTLRVLPLTNFLVSIYLFDKILNKSFENFYLKVLGIGLFAINFYLVEYALFIKQYMGDVMMTVLFLWLLRKDYETEEKRYFHLIITGGIGLFYSHITPVLMLTAACYLFLKNTSEAKKLIPLFTIWGVIFIFYYFNFVHNHELKDDMIVFWKKTMGFFPDLNQGKEIFVFFKWKWVLIFRDMMSMWSLSKYFIFSLFLIGLIALLFGKKHQLLILLFLPMLTHFILSILELYPFEPRLILYFIPLLILLVLYGIEYCLGLIDENFKVAMIFKGILVLIIGVSIFNTFQWKYPSVDPGIKGGMLILRNQLTDDVNKVYMSTIFSPAFTFYSHINYDGFENKLELITDKEWNALFFIPLPDWNAISILPQTESEAGLFFIMFSNEYTDKNLLLNEIKNRNGKVFHMDCFRDSCLIKMSWG